MTAAIRDSLAQVVALFRETAGTEWAAEGSCVVSDPRHSVYRGHITDCFDDDEAAFIAACHELIREHGPALLAVVEGRHE